MSVSKRALFKLAAGAGAAMTTAGARAAMPLPSLPSTHGLFTGRGRAESMVEACASVLDPIKQAAVDLAERKMREDRAALERKKRSLARLRSVSAAWVEAQFEIIERQDDAIYQAFRKFAYGD